MDFFLSDPFPYPVPFLRAHRRETFQGQQLALVQRYLVLAASSPPPPRPGRLNALTLLSRWLVGQPARACKIQRVHVRAELSLPQVRQKGRGENKT